MKNQSRCRLTKSLVESAEPEDREYVIWDTAIQGFGLRVRPTGGKSFIFVYRTGGGRAGKVKRVTISGNAEQARVTAKAQAAKYHGGGDPAAEKAEARNKATTVADTLDQFLDDYADEVLKPKTAAEYRRLVEKLLKPLLGRIPVEALTPKDVSDAYRSMRSKPTQAALAIRVLSSAMSMAEEWGQRPAGANPARIRLKGSRQRQRLFSDAEVARLLKAIDGLEGDGKIIQAAARGLRLLFASGCRADEVLTLEWSNVNFDAGTLRWPEYEPRKPRRTLGSKTGYLEKPITDEARALLESAPRIVGVPWVCPSANLKKMGIEALEGAFERVMAAAQVPANENASLHLIRHWFASKIYTDKAIPLALQMRIAGHKSVATAMRYAHATIEEVQKAAAGAAKRRATAIKAADKRGKVVAIKGRAAP